VVDFDESDGDPFAMPWAVDQGVRAPDPSDPRTTAKPSLGKLVPTRPDPFKSGLGGSIVRNGSLEDSDVTATMSLQRSTLNGSGVLGASTPRRETIPIPVFDSGAPPAVRMTFMGIEFFMDLLIYMCWHSSPDWLELQFLIKDELAELIFKRLKGMGVLEPIRTETQQRLLVTSLMALGDRVQLPKLTVNPNEIIKLDLYENPGMYKHLHIHVRYDAPDATLIFDSIDHPEIIKGEL
jgi:hypothetical protein